MSRILVFIYSNPSHFPPTLNALRELAKLFDEIDVLYRPYRGKNWKYSTNVTIHPSGAVMTPREQESLPLVKRWGLVAIFIKDMVTLCRRKKPDVVLLYDPIPLMAFCIGKIFLLNKPIIWYHNHDVLDHGNLKMFSLAWFAARTEKCMFRHIEIFSLPAEERKTYFPMYLFRGKYFFLPNLPAVAFYKPYTSKPIRNVIRLIYQGFVTDARGLEEIISLLPLQVNGKSIHIVLTGWVNKNYNDKLYKLIKERNAEEYVEMKGYTDYNDLPRLTASGHSGMAIYAKTDITDKTLGTASNKIYEYAAVGLPVLYFDSPHFREHLGKYEWAFATDLSEASLKNCLEQISAQHAELSQAARQDFMSTLNYEQYFQPLKKHLSELAKREWTIP